MSAPIAPFRQRLRRALDSEASRAALGRALPAFRQRRLEAFRRDDFSAIQRRLGRARAHALERLPELVRQFKTEAEKVGTIVHEAETIARAREIVAEIARGHAARLVVKSKSMATEEIGLNEHLEALGMRVVETDLGEYILQLGHDRPSHLIAPAIHWTREQVAELFSRVEGRQVSAEIAELVRVARARLRQDFIQADLGITGANLLIASTGTVVLVTNEGNGRLVSTLPPVHVVVAGVEKLVPDLDTAADILNVLARNATGQQMTSYVSFITGPSRSADIELTLATGVHGPLEVHVVLLDNGRWKTREDPELREALHCIKCGACANVCPPYQVVGGQAFGHIYTGPIGLVLTAIHHGLEAAAGPQSLCAGCHACEQVCPVGIPIPRQIIEVRQRVAKGHGLPFKKRAVIAALTDPVARSLARAAQAPFVERDGLIRSIPLAAGLASWRSVPGLAPRRFRERFAVAERRAPTAEGQALVPGSQAAGLRVAYFPGCLTDALRSTTGEAVVTVLRALGCRVTVPDGWSCCGLVASNAGERETATSLARTTLEALERAQADLIVSSATSCVVMLTQDAPRLLAGQPEWRERAERQAARVLDFARFVDSVARLPAGALARAARDGGRAASEVVTYHDACQSSNCLGLGGAARRLLRDVLGVELREMAESGVCCGFGGTFSIEHPEVSRRILLRKLDNALATGATTIVSDNAGCVIHLGGGLDKLGRPARAVHLAELMAERLT